MDKMGERQRMEPIPGSGHRPPIGTIDVVVIGAATYLSVKLLGLVARAVLWVVR